MTITNQCSDNTDMKIGAVFVGKLTMTFLKNLSVTPTSWKGRKISIVFGLCINEDTNTYEEFDVGQYYVSEANITTEEGIFLRICRSIQVEGAFGLLKNDFGFRRFLTRGKRNVRTELFLLGMGFNLKKL